MKKTCLVYANCQNKLIAEYLGRSPHFNQEYVIKRFPVHQLMEKGTTIPNRILKQAKLFIYQPVKDIHGDRSAKNIISKLSSNCRCISFPSLYFTGYFPQYCKNPVNKVIKPNYPYGVFPHGDSNIISLLKKGKSISEITEILSDPNFYTHEILLANLNETLEELARRESQLNIKVTSFIESYYRQYYLFHTQNHPSDILGMYVVNQILKLLNMPPMGDALSLSNPLRGVLDNIQIPIYPSVINHLELTFIDKKSVYRNASFCTNQMTFERYVSEYISLHMSNSESAIFYHFQGIKYFKQNKLAKASAVLEKAIKIRPNNAAYYGVLGNVLLKQNNLTEAELVYKKAIELSPDWQDFHYSLSNTLIKQNNLNVAQKTCQEKIKIDSNPMNIAQNITQEDLLEKDLLEKLATLQYGSCYEKIAQLLSFSLRNNPITLNHKVFGYIPSLFREIEINNPLDGINSSNILIGEPVVYKISFPSEYTMRGIPFFYLFCYLKENSHQLNVYFRSAAAKSKPLSQQSYCISKRTVDFEGIISAFTDNLSAICISDPGHFIPGLISSFYAGTKEINFAQLISRTIESICNDSQINLEDTFLVGSSAGGMGALLSSTYFSSKVNVLSINTQIFTYDLSIPMRRLLGTDEPQSLLKEFGDRVCCHQRFQQNINSIPNIYILANLYDDLYQRNYEFYQTYQYLFAKQNTNNQSVFDSYCGVEGHGRPNKKSLKDKIAMARATLTMKANSSNIQLPHQKNANFPPQNVACSKLNAKESEIKTQQLHSRKHLKAAIIGGSNSLMRNGYTKYLQEFIVKRTSKNIELSYFSLGAVTSHFGVIQNCRHNIAKNHDIIFFEYCVNDRSAVMAGKYSIRMLGMALEGFIRQAKSMNPNCIIIILIFGTNIPKYYNNCCQISATYESVARRYDIPVINITDILLATKGIKFIKSLYKKDEPAHYSRPEGAQIIGQIIAEQIVVNNWLTSKSQQINKYYRIYPGNLQNLKFLSNFDSHLNQDNIEKSTFKNSLLEEEIYTIKADSSLKFQFRGRLLGIVLKSDWYDGLFKIKLNEQELITSSFSTSVEQKENNNINLVSLPYYKSMNCNEFSELSISVCQQDVENYELDYYKSKPKVGPKDWKTSIVGIAYIGEIN